MVKIGDHYVIPNTHFNEIKKLKKDYTFDKVIGVGKHGVVCTGAMKVSNFKTEIAIKVINLENTSFDYQTKFLPKELNALLELKHLYIAFGGDVINMLEEKQYENGIPENRTKPLYRMIVSAVKHIHDLGSAHRDIKSENILLMDKNRTIAKLTDFGFSTTCFLPQTYKKILKRTVCGTPTYSPPEVERQQPYDAMKVDIWSLGVVLYVMLNNEMPFSAADVTKLAKNPKLNFSLEFKNKNLSKDCKDLILRQLDIDPHNRLNINKVIEHQWFR